MHWDLQVRFCKGQLCDPLGQGCISCLSISGSPKLMRASLSDSLLIMFKWLVYTRLNNFTATLPESSHYTQVNWHRRQCRQSSRRLCQISDGNWNTDRIPLSRVGNFTWNFIHVCSIIHKSNASRYCCGSECPCLSQGGFSFRVLCHWAESGARKGSSVCLGEIAPFINSLMLPVAFRLLKAFLAKNTQPFTTEIFSLHLLFFFTF